MYSNAVINVCCQSDCPTFVSCIPQNLLRQIELSGSLYVTESAISSLFSLAQEGAHLCRIIAKVRDPWSNQSKLAIQETHFTKEKQNLLRETTFFSSYGVFASCNLQSLPPQLLH